MALTQNQLDLTKLYLAGFNRAPEKSGLDYWISKLNAGTSLTEVINVIFSLDIVKAIYPDSLPDNSFLTLIYVNIFGKAPDAAGLAYWSNLLTGGQSRGLLVMKMIDVGLGTPDGTPGKAYIQNRLSAAQYAVDKQITSNKEISPTILKNTMLNVSADPASVTLANQTLNDLSNASGPLLSIAAATGGINAMEKLAGISVLADLSQAKAAAGYKLELLLGGNAFATPLKTSLSGADIAAGTVTFTIPATSWGVDGSKALSARLTDATGAFVSDGAIFNLTLDSTAPGAPTNAIVMAAASSGISKAEIAAGVSTTVSLAGTGAVAGDVVELLVDGNTFSSPARVTLTAANIASMSCAISITANDSGWGAAGSKAITARVTDLAGNPGKSGGTLTLTLLDFVAPNPVIVPLSIAAASNGIGAAEKQTGVDVLVNLQDTGVVSGDTIELLLNNAVFFNPVTHVITSAEAKAGSAKLTVSSTSGWGNDGSKTLSVKLTDIAGNVSAEGGSTVVMLDTTAPQAPLNVITSNAAGSGINAAEKNARVDTVIDLSGTGAVAGDRVELLQGGKSFTNPVAKILSSADISAGSTSLTIGNNDGWSKDGTIVLTARITDVAGNVGLSGGTLVTILDTTVPAALGKALYTDADVSGTINAGDTVAFSFTEATTKAVGLANISNNSAHLFGTGATAVWNAAGTVLTLTLGTGATLLHTDVITVTGVADAAGNSASIAFSI